MMEQVSWQRILDLSSSQKQSEVDAVLASAAFARSEQLRSFLRYVCHMEMEGRAEELNEYLVGIEALGRPATYSPSDDSSVRSRAWELRQKLFKVYSSERCDSEVRIDLPKGSYIPQYFVRSPESEQQTAGPQESQVDIVPLSPSLVENRQGVRLYLLVAVLAAAAGALAALGANQFWRSSSTGSIDPVIQEAWGPLLRSGSSDTIVMANGLYFLIRPEYAAGGPTNPQYPVPPQVYSQYRERRPLSADSRLTMFTSENAILMGYVNGLVDVTGLLQQGKVQFELAPERVVSTAELRKRNTILLGSPQDSIMISDLLSSGKFQFGYSPKHDIVLRKVNGPESDTEFDVGGSRAPHAIFITYGLITVVPSLGAEPQGPKTVVLSGITSVGAQGAAEFFSSPIHMRELKGRFRKQGLSGFPPAYQVVVRCKGSDTLLISYEYADSATILR